MVTEQAACNSANRYVTDVTGKVKMQGSDISVVVPLFNKRNCVIRALTSALNQSCAAKEIIVVDDGSTDGGGELVSAQFQYDVRYVKTENRGVSAARNAGIELATGSFIAFLDADDEWLDTHLEEISGLISKYPECGAYACAHYFEYSGGARIKMKVWVPVGFGETGVLKEYFKMAALGDNPLWTSAICIRSSVVDKIGLFDEKIRLKEDMHFWQRIVVNFPVAYSLKFTSIYHRNTENSATESLIPTEDDQRFLEPVVEAIASNVLFAEEARWAKRYINRHIRLNAFKALSQGNTLVAKRCLETYLASDGKDLFSHWILSAYTHIPSSIFSLIWRALKSIKVNLRKTVAIVLPPNS